MASLSERLHQAEFNEKSANADMAESPDWCVTKCFYAAVHYIDVYALYHKHRAATDYMDHRKREEYVDDIACENDCNDLSIIYRKLYRGSKQARYLEGISGNARFHFKDKAHFYIEDLQKLKSILQIVKIQSSLKAIQRPSSSIKQKPVDTL